jgi:hypothetical protein
MSARSSRFVCTDVGTRGELIMFLDGLVFQLRQPANETGNDKCGDPSLR